MSSSYRIVHCLRAPVGGLFRHVLDLAEEQAARGHQVGIMADATTSDALTKSKLEAIAPSLSLGLDLVAMSRQPGFGDLAAAHRLVRLAADKQAHVLHGHGAKGGAYARLAARTLKLRKRPVACFYTPHGGSLHFSKSSLEGRVYLALEKFLTKFTDGLIFESAFAQKTYAEKIGVRGCSARIIANGLRPRDFGQHQAGPDAADFLFVGELRQLKGVDVMLRALAGLNTTHPVTACFVGGGPDAQSFQDLAGELNLSGQTTFPGPLPALEAFSKGRCLIVPSRAESFPYIVLEAGAQAMPLIATDVGGIPEMTDGTELKLIPPDNVEALQTKMGQFLNAPTDFQDTARGFQDKVKTTYTIANMAQNIVSFYGEALDKVI